MSEKDEALVLANRVLDRINADPDDDLAVLARQLLIAHEARTVSEPDFEAMVRTASGLLDGWDRLVEIAKHAYAQGLAAHPLPAETVEALREACADAAFKEHRGSHAAVAIRALDLSRITRQALPAETVEAVREACIQAIQSAAIIERGEDCSQAVWAASRTIRALDLSCFTRQDAGETK